MWSDQYVYYGVHVIIICIICLKFIWKFWISFSLFFVFSLLHGKSNCLGLRKNQKLSGRKRLTVEPQLYAYIVIICSFFWLYNYKCIIIISIMVLYEFKTWRHKLHTWRITIALVLICVIETSYTSYNTPLWIDPQMLNHISRTLPPHMSTENKKCWQSHIIYCIHILIHARIKLFCTISFSHLVIS